jgi:zinc/manganese transport system ATP-binding protein
MNSPKQRRNSKPVIEIANASLGQGARILWQDLSMQVQPGEFIAVLGPNGAGKTTLLKALLGLLPLTSGRMSVLDQPAHRGNPAIGYVPQQKSFDRALPIRGRDLVELGVNGFRYGIASRRKATNQLVNKAITAVGADSYADKPIGLLSGGEQQRLRIAQALVSEPKILLCDEPLLSLDVASQASITSLINVYRTRTKAAVIFVTHEINPILQYVDRILYLANGQWVIDTPKKVLDSSTLTRLYGTAIEVLHVKHRILIVGAADMAMADHGGHHEAHE